MAQHLPLTRPGAASSAATSRHTGRNCLILFLVYFIIGGLYYCGNWSDRYLWPLSIISVYIHEMGHFVADHIVGAKVEALHLEILPDITQGAQGFVRSLSDPTAQLSRALTAAAGSLAQVLMGMAFVLAGRREKSSIIFLVACLPFCAWSLFYADTLVTGVIIVLCAIVWGLAAKFLRGPLLQFFMMFSGIAIALAMLNNWRYLFMEETSDMAHLSQALFFPVWFWGCLMFAAGVAIILLGTWTFIRGELPPAPKKVTPPGLNS